MRKIVKLFLLVITCLFVFSLTSCGESHADATLVDVDSILFPNSLVLPKTEEGKTFVGYYTFDEESKTGYLYLVGSVIPDGKYEEVYVSGENQVKYSFPSYAHGRDGYYFAGWYLDQEFENKVTGEENFRLQETKIFKFRGYDQYLPDWYKEQAKKLKIKDC